MNASTEKEIFNELVEKYYTHLATTESSSIDLKSFYSTDAYLIRIYPGKKSLCGRYDSMVNWIYFNKTKSFVISKYDSYQLNKDQPINFNLKGYILSTRNKKYYFNHTFILESTSPLKILQDALFIIDPDDERKTSSFNFISYQEEEEEDKVESVENKDVKEEEPKIEQKETINKDDETKTKNEQSHPQNEYDKSKQKPKQMQFTISQRPYSNKVQNLNFEPYHPDKNTNQKSPNPQNSTTNSNYSQRSHSDSRNSQRTTTNSNYSQRTNHGGRKHRSKDRGRRGGYK